MIFGFDDQLPRVVQSTGKPHATKMAMESLKIVSYKSRLVKLQPTCSICMEDFKDTQDQTIRAMPCGHVYHQECIFAWLENSNTCCNCRYEIETDNHEYNIAMKKRMAKLRPVFTEHECALAAQGACDFEDENGVYFEDVEASEAKHVLQASCGCSYHDSCLRTSLIIRGYLLKEEGGPITFRCTKCHKDVEITIPPLNKICEDYEEEMEGKGKEKGKEIEEEVKEEEEEKEDEIMNFKEKKEEKVEIEEKLEKVTETDIEGETSTKLTEKKTEEEVVSKSEENIPSEIPSIPVLDTEEASIPEKERCALIPQDLCDFEGSDGTLYGSPDEPKPIVKASCGCYFHNSCLRSALIIRNYNLVGQENKSLDMRCPKCNKNATVTLLS
ncbi:hypothetical protein H8356DRAFT_1644025 [Neocallimastix lanati (nom. inval.)]|nr:hypothetical protein H8356DRAFT_1644025 [Neocallimastix sp. JGI-2020a]